MTRTHTHTSTDRQTDRHTHTHTHWHLCDGNVGAIWYELLPLHITKRVMLYAEREVEASIIDVVVEDPPKTLRIRCVQQCDVLRIGTAPATVCVVCRCA